MKINPTMKPSSTKAKLAWALVGAFAFSIILTSGLFGAWRLWGDAVKYQLGLSEIPFESAAWKTNLRVIDNNMNPVKLSMVDDLMNRYRLVGLSRRQVDDLLGTPPQVPYFKNYEYVYWLGPERGVFRIDSEWLCIKFKEGKVIEAVIARD